MPQYDTEKPWPNNWDGGGDDGRQDAIDAELYEIELAAIDAAMAERRHDSHTRVQDAMLVQLSWVPGMGYTATCIETVE